MIFRFRREITINISENETKKKKHVFFQQQWTRKKITRLWNLEYYVIDEININKSIITVYYSEFITVYYYDYYSELLFTIAHIIWRTNYLTGN